jgi:hypothetical protein
MYVKFVWRAHSFASSSRLCLQTYRTHLWSARFGVVTSVMSFHLFWQATSYRLENSYQPLWRGRFLKTYICMFRIHHYTRSHMFSCNSWLVSSMNPKCKRNISTAKLCLSYILHHYLNKSCEFSHCLLRTIHYLSPIYVAVIWDYSLQFRALAMLLLTELNYKIWCWMILRWNNIFTKFREN